jgi:hypothetical protein
MAKATYNVIIRVLDTSKGANGFVKYRNVNSLQKLKKHIEKSLGQWLFMTVYDHKTKNKLAVLSRENIHLFEPLKIN